jgi:Na+-translocating ferredoxin:NAD+ oxidoreductase subunit E
MSHDHGHAAAAPAPAGKAGPTATEDLLKGIWRENPVLVQLLGLCPTLAVTNTLANSLGMAVATAFVLICSSLLVSSMRKLIPNEVRITGYILIIATFVTIADMMLEAMVPVIHKALGAFIALIVVNCIILGRQEAFSAKHSVSRSVLDAVGMSIGFTLMLVIMGGVRELLGSGALLGYPVLGTRFEPWVIMVLPPGGFFTLAGVLLVMGWRKQRAAAPAPDLTPRTVEVRRDEPALEPAGV